MPDTTSSASSDTIALLRAATVIVALCFALRKIDVLLIRFNKFVFGKVVTSHTKVFLK